MADEFKCGCLSICDSELSCYPRPATTDENIKEMLPGPYLGTVSYTHLDVYKRQELILYTQSLL